MRLAGYKDHLPSDKETILKVNISWHHYYPGCSTAPWQLEGVIKTLTEDGYAPDTLMAGHNRTVVVDAKIGEVKNKHKSVVEKYGVRNVHLYEPWVEWLKYEPKTPLLALDRVFPQGIHIPALFVGRNICHLPTVKTHVFTTITGAMKNAFGGLLNENRHWAHAAIHETLVDLLIIQREIHSGIFAVMDGTIAGEGPGPRAMVPHVKNIILASGDQVAIDAISAKLMGLDPLSIEFIRLAHEMGLGVGDPRQIELVGDDISNENWHFQANKDTLASRGQKVIYHGPLKPLEHLLLRSPLTPWSYIASRLYYDFFWFPLIGKRRVARMMETPWGRLFRTYEPQG
ncbi:MAG: DUF362 domain-containing protein [Chloroflexi bacterium]|nr:DUF362 domain-containing protein [Chloroflexota bacterium]